MSMKKKFRRKIIHGWTDALGKLHCAYFLGSPHFPLVPGAPSRYTCCVQLVAAGIGVAAGWVW